MKKIKEYYKIRNLKNSLVISVIVFQIFKSQSCMHIVGYGILINILNLVKKKKYMIKINTKKYFWSSYVLV